MSAVKSEDDPKFIRECFKHELLCRCGHWIRLHSDEYNPGDLGPCKLFHCPCSKYRDMNNLEWIEYVNRIAKAAKHKALAS